MILRRLTIAVLAGGALLGCTALLGDFDVLDANEQQPPGNGTDAEADNATSNIDGSTSADGGDGAPPLSCNAPFVACPGAAQCVVPLSDPEHCGACGHSCGGGACDNGVCKPAKLYELPASSTAKIDVIDVGATHLFFSTTDSTEQKAFSCPIGGCKGMPATQLASMQYAIRAISAVNNVTFAFLSAPTQTTERPAVYACGLAGCPSPPVSFTGDGLNGVDDRFRTVGNRIFHFRGGSGIGYSTCDPATPGNCAGTTSFGSMTRNTRGFTADATNVYFIDTQARGYVIATCLQTDTSCTPAQVVAGDHSDLEALETEGGKLYFIRPGREDFNEGKLYTCNLPSCTPQVIANGLSTNPHTTGFKNELRVDATGAYWLTTTKKIQRCAPNGCLGGAKDVIGPINGIHSLVLDASFVYWAEEKSIWRLAK